MKNEKWLCWGYYEIYTLRNKRQWHSFFLFV